MTAEEIRAFVRAEGPKYLPRGHSYSLTFGTAMFLAGLEAAREKLGEHDLDGADPQWLVDQLIASAKEAAK